MPVIAPGFGNNPETRDEPIVNIRAKTTMDVKLS